MPAFSDMWLALGSMEVVGKDVGGGRDGIAGAEGVVVMVGARAISAGGRGSIFSCRALADFARGCVKALSLSGDTGDAGGVIVLDADDTVGASYLAPNRSPHRISDLPNSRR